MASGSNTETHDHAPDAVRARINQSTALRLLDLARQQFAAGSHAKSIACCEQVLLRLPGHADALCLKARNLNAQQDIPGALTLLLQTLKLAPEHPGAWQLLTEVLKTTPLEDAQQSALFTGIQDEQLPLSLLVRLGKTLFDTGAYHTAVKVYALLAAANPRNSALLIRYADCLKLDKQPEAAEQTYARALALTSQPNPADLVRYGLMLAENHKYSPAELQLRKALQSKPDYFPALLSLTELLLNRARYAQALPYVEQLLKTHGQDHRVQLRAANIFMYTGAYARAKSMLFSLLDQAPGLTQAYQALSFVYHKTQDYELARLALHKALALEPENPAIFLNLGALDERELQPRAALRQYRQGLALSPDDPNLQHNLSYALLRLGQFEEGFQLYESRFKGPNAIELPPHSSPRWQGQPLQGKTLYIQFEQGYGDFLLCLAYCKVLHTLGARLIMQCPKELSALALGTGAVDELLTRQEQSCAADFHIPLMSLPGIFQEGRSFRYPASPFLHADPARVAQWQQRLEPVKGTRVGLCWQGRPTFAADEIRSFELMQFLPLADLPQVSLLSIQKEPAGKAQIPEFRLFAPLIDVDELSTEERDFMATAAILANLDLLITSDTSVAHLAGGLGLPVWLVLGNLADWRWFVDREDSYWYPSMRLFRQAAGEASWDPVFARVTAALQEHQDQQPRTLPTP